MWTPEPTNDEKSIAMLSHILAIVPGIGILGPLIIYVIRNKDSQYISYHAKESLNFQISIFIFYIIGAILVFVLIGFLIGIFVWIGNIVMVIFGALAANRGDYFRYPLNMRILK